MILERTFDRTLGTSRGDAAIPLHLEMWNGQAYHHGQDRGRDVMHEGHR
jgi:hypothetical protein